MHLKKLRVILYFYCSLSGATLSVSIASWLTLFYWRQMEGAGLIIVLLIFKVISNVLIAYLANSMRNGVQYYYYNLHISGWQLWLGSFLFDMLIFISGLWIIY